MNLKKQLEENLNLLNKDLKIIEKADKKQISILNKKYEEKLIDELHEFFPNKQIIKDLLKEYMLNMKTVSSDIDDFVYASLINACASLKEIIDFIINNPVINSKMISKVENIYASKLKEINPFNDKVKYLYKNNFNLLFYNLSIELDLKNNIESYKKIEKILDTNKKYFLNELIKIINNKTKDSKMLVKKHLVEFTKSLNDSIKVIQDNNYNKINEYALTNLKIFASEKVEFYLRDSYDYILKNIDLCHKKVLKLEKVKENNSITKSALILKDYLLNYNNSLYSKANLCVQNMNKIVTISKEKAAEKIDEYNSFIYNIYDLEYNFDKQFNDYKLKMLKKKNIITTQKTIDDVTDLINECKENISLKIKENVLNLFKNILSNLIVVNDETNMIKYKLINCSEEIDEKTVKLLYEKNKASK